MRDDRDLWGLLYTPLKETVDNYLFRGLDGDSLLAVDCVRRMLRSRSGQSDRLEDDDAGAGDPLPLSRGEGAPHHGQTVKSRQAADFSRKKKRKPEGTKPSGSSPDLERRHGLVEN